MPDRTDLVPKKKYNDLFDLTDATSEGEARINDKCKLCKSPHRADAEEYWMAKRRNHAAVVHMLSERGEDISDKSVKRHMEQCYLPGLKRMMVKGYANRLKDYVSVESNRLRDIEICRAVLTKSMVEMAAEAELQPVFEQAKLTELVLKIVAQIMACNEQERKINEEWKPANVVIEKLNQIVRIELDHASEDVKPVLAKVVSTLYDEMKGLKFDK